MISPYTILCDEIGTPLGTIGSTGSSTSSHAHCCLYQNVNDIYLGTEKAIQFIIRGQSWGMTGAPTKFAANFKFDANQNTGRTSLIAGNGVNISPIDDSNIKVIPNPVSNGNFSLSFSSNSTDPGRIAIYSQLGKLVFSQNATFMAGSNLLKIQVPNLISGLYYVQVITPDKVYSTTFIEMQ